MAAGGCSTGKRVGLSRYRPRSADADDHMFFADAGKSTPADYERPQHVDAAVVAGIADWPVPGRGRGQSPGSSPASRGSTGYAEAGSGELWLVEVKQVLVSY